MTDVLVNGSDHVFIDRGAGLELTDVRFPCERDVHRLAQRLAVSVGRRLDEAIRRLRPCWVAWGGWDALPGENPDDCLRSQNADTITQISNVIDEDNLDTISIVNTVENDVLTPTSTPRTATSSTASSPPAPSPRSTRCAPPAQ